MDKFNTTNNSNSEIAYIHPYIKNYDTLKQKSQELTNKWQEVQQLINEIEEMELPIEFRASLKQN